MKNNIISGKILLILVILFSFYACHQTEVNETYDPGISVKLPDSIGTLTFPNYLLFDTSFSWRHISDCNCCGNRKIRFQYKADSILMESGWLSPRPPRQRTYMTIILPEFSKCTSLADLFHLDFSGKNMKARYEAISGNKNYFVDNVITCKSNLAMYVLAYLETWDSPATVVEAITFKGHDPLRFRFEHTSASTDTNFVKNCCRTLEKMKFE